MASIGVGAKDITAIDWISDHVRLDWAMFACSITPYSHGDAAKRLLKKLGAQGGNSIDIPLKWLTIPFHSVISVTCANYSSIRTVTVCQFSQCREFQSKVQAFVLA